MNDIGILTNILYKTNINAISEDKSGVNLGAVYESVAAQELKGHGHQLFYYDRRKIGEIDFLIDDYDNLSVLPIEIKSGGDSYELSALSKVVNNQEYQIKHGYLFSNQKEVFEKDNILYFPIYFIMFI